MKGVNMKKIISYTAIVISLTCGLVACSSSKRSSEKAAEKRITALQDSVAGVHAVRALKDCHFVLLADRISFGPRGQVFNNPRPETNFLYMLGDEGVVQFAFENGRLGLNGLGGITCKGRVNNLKILVDKKGDTRVKYSLFGANVSAQVDIVLYKNSDEARALVSGNFNSGSMTIYGKVKPYNGQ